MYHDVNKQGEREHSVSLSEQDKRAAMRLLSLLAGLNDDVDLERPPTPCPVADLSREALRERARRALHDRHRRTQLFAKSMFAEPAWDMLLALYVTEGSSARHTIGRLVSFAGAPPTTAMRWVEFLEAQQLVVREVHPTDRRTFFIHLSSKGRHLLDVYFSETFPIEG